MLNIFIDGCFYYIIKYNSHEKLLFEPEDIYGDWALLPLLDRSPKKYTFSAATLKDLFPAELNDGQNYYLVTYDKPIWSPFRFSVESMDKLNKIFYKIIDNDSSKI